MCKHMIVFKNESFLVLDCLVGVVNEYELFVNGEYSFTTHPGQSNTSFLGEYKMESSTFKRSTY